MPGRGRQPDSCHELCSGYCGTWTPPSAHPGRPADLGAIAGPGPRLHPAPWSRAIPLAGVVAAGTVLGNDPVTLSGSIPMPWVRVAAVPRIHQSQLTHPPSGLLLCDPASKGGVRASLAISGDLEQEDGSSGGS